MAIALKEDRPVRGVEALAQRPDGSLVPFLPFPTPLHDETGALVGAVNMLVDLSERRQAESRQRMLIEELNHRVKDNMQMLYSLLHAAQRDTQNGEARAVLADASQRIAAMAAAQKQLYSDQHPRTFSVSEFLHAVCASARPVFAKDVTVRIEADPGYLPNDTCMPLALILNELLTKSAKHGVNGSDAGEITVALRRVGAHVVLSVEDNGPGFELGDTRRRSSGLGLVRGLTQQLRGSFKVERASGARCTVTFAENRTS
jgi:two-component sensor histidine kinase